MSPRLDDDRGIALVSAILLLAAILAIGLGVVSYADTQQHAARQERTREASFNIAEAALNAQVFALSKTWPTATNAVAQCDATSTAAVCPTATDLGGFTGPDYNAPATACPALPGGAAPLPLWKVTVRDNAAALGGTQSYNKTLEGAPAYDANGDNKVWVRATGNAQCHPQVLVTLVSRNLVPVGMAEDVIAAGWFATANQGKKVLIDTLGTHASAPGGPAAQRADLVVRCRDANGNQLAASTCERYSASKGQVSPDSTRIDYGMNAQTLSATQIADLRQQAILANSYYPNGTTTCPSGAQLSSPAPGVPVFVEGPCDLTVGGNTVVNSVSSPGLLVIANGSLSMGGASQFYGLVYDANCQPSGATTPCTQRSDALVSLTGTALIQGMVIVDGAGGVSAGASKYNIVYDSRAAGIVHQFSGATLSRNSWHVIPTGQAF